MDKIHNFLDQLYQAFKLISISRWLQASLIFGMAFMGLFVALILFGISCVQYFGGVTPYLVDIFPESYLVLQKIDKSFGGTNTVGLLLFFFPIAFAMATYVLYLLEDFLDNILGYLQERSLTKRASSYWIVLSLVPIPYFGSWIYSIFTLIVEIDYGAFFFLPFISPILILFISIFSYTMTYKIFSKEVFKWKTSLQAGIVAGVLFEIFKYIFIYFLKEHINLGATSVLVIGFMLFSIWFCINGSIYALGGRLGFYVEFRNIFDPSKRKLLGISEGRSTREIALICLLELIKRFYNSRDVSDYNNIGLDIREICEYCMISPKRAKNVLGHLRNVKLVRILLDENKEIVVLNFSPENLELKKFISIIEERKEDIEKKDLPDSKASCWFWNNYQESLDSAFGGKTLKDLYEIQTNSQT